MAARATTKPTLFTALSIALMITSACSGSRASDRAGGDTLILKMATVDGYDFGSSGGFLTGPETFASALEQASGGRMRLDVTVDYGNGASAAETKLAEAIADGTLDGGWPATRAFSGSGIRSLEAIEAPLELTSSAAVDQLISGVAGEAALHSLQGTGITGLALLDGGLRRPFANRMLLSPHDWAGARMRVFGSPVQQHAMSALGATPVDAGTHWHEMVKQGTLDGAEFGVDGYANNGYGDEAGNLPLNVVLWPKVLVLSMSTKRYESLTDQQRHWVREATEKAVSAARSAAPVEQDFIPALCKAGMHFGSAAGWQLAQLRTALAPVVQGLRDDPATAPLMEQVEAIAHQHPLPDVLAKPADCAAASDVGVPSTASNLPSGVWRVAIPVKAVTDAGLDNNPGWSGVWTLTVKDATYVLSCTPLDAPLKDCGNAGRPGTFESGYLKGEAHTVFFVGDESLMRAAGACPSGCDVLDPYGADWHADGDRLTFTAQEGSHLTILPWTRIAKS